VYFSQEVLYYEESRHLICHIYHDRNMRDVLYQDACLLYYFVITVQ
jgi:hypothetical protein